MMTDAIELRGIGKRFGDRTVLDGLDLGVPAGTVYALLGANGAGKTTTIRILTTLLRPDAGTAVVAGIDVVRDPAAIRRSISVTGQSAAVDGLLTVEENLVLMARLFGLRGAAVRRRAAELIERFGLGESRRRRVGALSGGMRRRLDVAVCLLTVPPVVLLDEPSTGLGAGSRRELWEVVRGLAADGTTVLLTTQYLEEADRLADRIGVLHGGRLAVEGTAGELKARIGSEVLALHDAGGVLLREQPLDGTPADLRRAIEALAPGPSDRVSIRTPSLDDVFLAVTAHV